MSVSKRAISGESAGVLSVITAIAASACCIGPAILLALGVGGLGFASFLDPYRPYFLGLTAVLLGSAFYFAYRPVRAEACAADGHCAPASRKRMRTTVWIASAVALLAGFYPYIEGARAQAPLEEQGIRAVSLDIKGMTCSACANHIRAELEKVDGVQGAVVRYPEADARVELESSDVSDDELLEAVKRAGYQGSIHIEEEVSTLSTSKRTAPAGCCAAPAVTVEQTASAEGESDDAEEGK